MKVAVIGASLAGLTVARELANADINVDVFEAKKDIKRFACGEVIRTGCYGVEKPKKGVLYEVKKLIFDFGERVVRLKVPKGVYMTERDKVQEWLYYEAVSAGANINLGCVGLIRKLRKEYDYVLDCSGYPSQSYREFGIGKVNKIAVAVFMRIRYENIKPDGNLFFYPYSDRIGYTWFFPMKNGVANVGTGWIVEDYRYPRFDDIPWGKSRVLKKGGGILPVDRARIGRCTILRYGNVFLVGESAGLMNYILEAGNHLAIASAKIAAKSIIEGRDYEKEIERVLGAEVTNSKAFLEIMCKMPKSLKPVVMNVLGIFGWRFLTSRTLSKVFIKIFNNLREAKEC